MQLYKHVNYEKHKNNKWSWTHYGIDICVDKREPHITLNLGKYSHTWTVVPVVIGEQE